MTDEQKAMLGAFGAVLKNRLSTLEPGSQRIEFPAPTVNVRNEVSVPSVSVTNEVQVPNVSVTNEVAAQPPATVTVNCDVSELAVSFASAVAGMASAVQAMAGQLDAALKAFADAQQANAEMLSQLVQVLASQPRPVFKPNVTVEAPSVKVVQPARTPKRLRVLHSDGTESMVEELPTVGSR